MDNSIFNAIVGGAVIGLAASFMLIFNGRVTGIAGIYNGLLKFVRNDIAWRLAFTLGLVVGGAVMYFSHNEYFLIEMDSRSNGMIVLAGLLVGFGTVMGAGCTSGHGVCGIARLSPRSLVATATFMFFGFLSATIFRILFIGG